MRIFKVTYFWNGKNNKDFIIASSMEAALKIARNHYKPTIRLINIEEKAKVIGIEQ